MNQNLFRPDLGEVLRRAIDCVAKYRPIFGFTKPEIVELYQLYQFVCDNERDPEGCAPLEPDEPAFDPYAFSGVSRSDFI